jgi:TonB family protein
MKLNIPQPCPADWNQMKIGAIGRHCLQCEKTVVDFTGMRREEMVLYLLQNQSNSVCGRFRKSQLDYYHLEELITIQSLRKLPPKKAALLLTLACAVLASCQQPSPSETQSTDITATAVSTFRSEIDSTTIDTTTGKTVAAKKHTPEKDTIPEVFMAGMVEMGEVIAMPIDTIEVTELLFGTTSEDTTIYHIAEQMPEFPGGMDSLFAFVHRTLKMPKTFNYAVGKIYIRFVVEKDGSITHPEVLRTTKGALEFDEEALRIIGKMPNWIPGQMREKPVRTYYTIPISFK